MGRFEVQKTINDNLRKHFRIGRHVIAGPGRHSVLAFNLGSTYEHELGKFNEAWKLLQNGHTIITEGILKSGLRPDICILDVSGARAVEIMKSETEESIQKKEKDYGMPIDVVRV